MVNPNRYDDWIPRDDRFDDGGFVTEPVGRYQPNPWGLHDMHGNAWEWTRSAYRPYPYREDDGRNALARAGEERVVRGGSWYDRPETLHLQLPACLPGLAAGVQRRFPRRVRGSNHGKG